MNLNYMQKLVKINKIKYIKRFIKFQKHKSLYSIENKQKYSIITLT